MPSTTEMPRAHRCHIYLTDEERQAFEDFRLRDRRRSIPDAIKILALEALDARLQRAAGNGDAA